MNKKTIKTTNRCYARSTAISIAVAMLLSACQGDESGKRGEDIIGLSLSLSDYRFGVQDVGSNTPQTFELKNVGVDTYPINDISVSGENAEDFDIAVEEGITLEPGDKLALDVAFSPIGEGQRVASLDIDYDVIEGIGSNLVESGYYMAREKENAGDNVAAAADYRDYLNAGATTDNKARALIKLSLLEEADVYGVGKDFTLYKSALNLRDEGDIGAAIAALNKLVSTYPDSYLLDDAMYMLGYIQLVDKSHYNKSIELMQKLIDEHPDSAYYDTALYSQGLAQYELGNEEKSEEIFLSLRDRHTGVQLDLFEMRWPKDNYVSRLWFDKADEQLASMEEEATEES